LLPEITLPNNKEGKRREEFKASTKYLVRYIKILLGFLPVSLVKL
jgi:hypothetical protein